MSTERKPYDSDLTDEQWDRVSHLIPTQEAGRPGRPRETEPREYVNAIAYRWQTGCTWRMLPHDFPAWPSVYAAFRRWRREGVLQHVRGVLLDGEDSLQLLRREIADQQPAITVEERRVAA